MTIAARVLGVRYAYRTELHDDGPGTDGIVVLRESNGTRHGALMFEGAFAMELLEALFNDPGEPLMAHELFVAMLKSSGTEIVSLTLEHVGDGEGRPGSITTEHGDSTTTRGCGAYDLVGLALATGLPINVDDRLFESMHALAPPLDEMMGTKKLTAADIAEREALLDDGSTIGRA